MSIYKPLNEEVDSLRVLVLHPKSGGNEIVCDLENRTFASKPVYEALSYTWGAPPASKAIQINGKCFFVRVNLYNALHSLRKSGLRYLWCDAICINQGDISERNYQVGIMSYIFARARRVNVWLGLSLDRTSDGGTEYTDPRKFMLYNEANATALANHPYWSRVWVVQEQVLARSLEIYLDDNCHMSGDQFYSLVGDYSKDIGIERINRIKEQRDQRHSDEHRFEQLIDTFQDCQCTEPRDGVYGFLGMAHDNEMEVDYSMSFYKLYAKTIDFHQYSEFLNAEVPEDRFWLEEVNDRAARLVMFSQLLQKILNGAVETERLQGGQTDVLVTYRARGGLIGKIKHLGPTYAEIIGSAKADRLWKKALEQNYKGENLRLMRERNETYTRELEEWDTRKVKTFRPMNTRTSYGEFWSGEDKSIEIPDSDVSKTEGSEPRRFLATQRVMGFAPPGARVGDWVCAFYGCTVHIILRKTAREKWMIVGRADAVTALTGFQNERDDLEAAVNFDLEQLRKKLDLDDMYDYREDSDEDEDARMQARDMVMNLKLDLHVLQQLTC